MRLGVALLFGAVLSLATSAMANEPPPKKPDANAAKPPPPSGLTGNVLPHCDLGYYPAGNICKPAPPGFYAGPNARYPTVCPAGKTSAYGARGTSECY